VTDASDITDVVTTTAMLPASACAAVSSAAVVLLSPLSVLAVLLLQGDMPNGLLPRQQFESCKQCSPAQSCATLMLQLQGAFSAGQLELLPKTV